jgi:hypothetical protein
MSEFKLCIEKCKLSHLQDPHDQTCVTLPTGKKISVDTGLAPLLQNMWKTGIETRMSCENNVPKNYLWLHFDAENAQKFVQHVVNYCKLTDGQRDLSCDQDQEHVLYEHIIDRNSGGLNWQYQTRAPEDRNTHWTFRDEDDMDGECEVVGPIKMEFEIGIRIPHCDFLELCKAFNVVS